MDRRSFMKWLGLAPAAAAAPAVAETADKFSRGLLRERYDYIGRFTPGATMTAANIISIEVSSAFLTPMRINPRYRGEK